MSLSTIKFILFGRLPPIISEDPKISAAEEDTRDTDQMLTAVKEDKRDETQNDVTILDGVISFEIPSVDKACKAWIQIRNNLVGIFVVFASAAVSSAAFLLFVEKLRGYPLSSREQKVEIGGVVGGALLAIAALFYLIRIRADIHKEHGNQLRLKQVQADRLSQAAILRKIVIEGGLKDSGKEIPALKDQPIFTKAEEKACLIRYCQDQTEWLEKNWSTFNIDPYSRFNIFISNLWCLHHYKAFFDAMHAFVQQYEQMKVSEQMAHAAYEEGCEGRNFDFETVCKRIVTTVSNDDQDPDHLFNVIFKNRCNTKPAQWTEDFLNSRKNEAIALTIADFFQSIIDRFDEEMAKFTTAKELKDAGKATSEFFEEQYVDNFPNAIHGWFFKTLFADKWENEPLPTIYTHQAYLEWIKNKVQPIFAKQEDSHSKHLIDYGLSYYGTLS